MALYPYARVAHLTGLTPAPYMTASPYGHKSTSTPTTISGGPTMLYSYALCIMYRDIEGRGCWVSDPKGSPTSNRHIRTVHAFLDHNGYTRTDEWVRGGYTGMYLWVPRAV